MERPVRVVVLGCGMRGRAYAEYAAAHPMRFSLVGVADPAVPPGEFPGRVWGNWRDPFADASSFDAAIVALPDRLHRDACLAALGAGKHVLLEKPIGATWRECEEIRDAQRKSGKTVLAGFVLRFSPYYRKLRCILSSGEIGDLTSIHHLVAISYGKAAHAFCRGCWAREEDGTGTLVQKCSHDFDLVSRWAGGRRCLNIESYGSLVHFRPENAPPGAAARCTGCAPETKSRCPFDAEKLYLLDGSLRYHFPDGSDAAMREVVDSSQYGRCVYACGNDTVDHQTAVMEFEGGMVATIEMESFSKRRARITHFFGTRGEIVADGEKIEVMPFSGPDRVVVPGQSGHHGGGDSAIMESFARFVRRSTPDRAAKIMDEAMEPHRLAFLAEKRRKAAARTA